VALPHVKGWVCGCKTGGQRAARAWQSDSCRGRAPHRLAT
jgi:hypothetical protein